MKEQNKQQIKETEYFEQNFDKEILDEIRKIAVKEKRSVTQQINIIATIGIQQYNKGVRLI